MKNILFAVAVVTGAGLFCAADSAEAANYYRGRTAVPARGHNTTYLLHGDHIDVVRMPQTRNYGYRAAPRYRSNYQSGRVYTPVYHNNHSHADHHNHSDYRNQGYGSSRNGYVQPVRPTTQYFGLNFYR